MANGNTIKIPVKSSISLLFLINKYRDNAKPYNIKLVIKVMVKGFGKKTENSESRL